MYQNFRSLYLNKATNQSSIDLSSIEFERNILFEKPQPNRMKNQVNLSFCIIILKSYGNSAVIEYSA